MITLPVLRRSAMQSAKSCLFRYNQLWNLHVPDQNDFSLRGIGFHSCAHRYIERLVHAQLEQDAEEAKLAFTEGIASALIPAHLVPEVREIFYGWAERFGLSLQRFVAAEEHQIGKNQQTFTPDLVYADGACLEIIDFKTYWATLTEEQVRNDWQVRFYIYNAQRIWPNFPTYRFTHSYVRFGTNVSVEFQPSDLAAFADEVEAIVATIQEATERNEWPATAGSDCPVCSLKCPLADNPAVTPVRFTVPQQAQMVGSWLLADDSRRRAAQKALKAYCAANGPLRIGEMTFDNRPTQTRTYPIEDVMKILQARGIMGAFDKDTSPGLTISHSALSKLFRAYPALESDLLPVQQAKTTYRFSAKKPGVGDEDDE